MTQNASSLIAAQPSSPEEAGGLQNLAIETADQPARDRIAEAYLGHWSSGSTQQRARARVNWIAACACGPRILDIGCSEGMLELLLARAGHQVLGLDIEPAAIAAARDLVRSEPAAVRDRIDLRVADALRVDLGEAGFDTVVLGEVLEHLRNPAAMLERAAAFLKPGGRLVLTTPFGYFPHCDHGQEFRTTELVRLLTARFVIDELTTADGYFRVVAHTLSAPVLQERRAPDLHDLLLTTEEAAIAWQHHLHGQLKQLQGQLALKKDNERVAAEKTRRLLLQVEHQERVAAERIRRLLDQLEHQKRVVVTAQMRMRQAQLELKQERTGLRQELGRIIEKSLSSPIGILRLPYRIIKVYRRARKGAGPDQDEAASPTEASRVDAIAPEAAAAARTKALAAPKRPNLHRDVSDAFPPYPFPERPPRTSRRVATILDEFSDSCFRYEADLVRLTKEAWREEIERERPAFLLVESAWRGNRENWRGLIQDADSILDNPLDALVDYCRDEGIPTVFWNKEDPPNFESFIDAAAKFDHVFTTDANCIERYRARLGHERIAALPFAAQPAIHNPIGKLESDDYEIAFAGTWYGQKHVERGALLPILLDVAVDYRLHIFDRMSAHTRNDFYRFPDKYGPFLRKSLPYPNILSAYRRFKVFLNVNSVTDSPTMFARRVFEILASSTAVVSTASSGIEQMLGDAVSVVHDEDEARSELDRLLADPIYRQRKAHLGYRRVLRDHTCTARFCTIARAIGLDLEDPCELPKVSLVVPLGDERWLDNALANLRRQRYAAIEPLWIVKDGAVRVLAERVMREYPGGTIAEVSADASFATMLRRGIELAPGPLVAAFDPRDLYGPEFVGDLALALTYADAGIVGKAAHFVALPSGAPPALNEAAARFRHRDQVLGTAWLGRREALDRIGIDRMLTVEDGRPMMACGHGCDRAYGADPYNYLRFGHADVAPEAVAACLDEHGSIAIGRAEVIV
jgi:2-polyprenyl-3-methyl-5-hydroxy-6-metoxy-1,4-benzoquinol methylase